MDRAKAASVRRVRVVGEADPRGEVGGCDDRLRRVVLGLQALSVFEYGGYDAGVVARLQLLAARGGCEPADVGALLA